MQNLRKAMQVVCVLALACVVVDAARAQCTEPTRRARLVAHDTGAGRDTLWFGFHPNATRGLNTALCEVEYPPFPPSGVWEARWMNPPGYEGIEPPDGLGQGVKKDYRKQLTTATIDTYLVKFQPGVPPGYPVRFKWIRSEVLGICDSCVLMDAFGGLIIPRTNMVIRDSLQVSTPAITELWMIRYGQKASGVEQTSSGIPGTFALQQNFPNPFNPSTTIEFAVQRSSMTHIAVYDLLGREVATLAAEYLSPGFYTVKWNGTNNTGAAAASGVYFVRMSAQTDNGASFTALRKLLLMK